MITHFILMNTFQALIAIPDGCKFSVVVVNIPIRYNFVRKKLSLCSID